MRHSSRLIALALGCAIAFPASAQQLIGSGSTFVYPIMTKWSAAYEKTSGIRVEYAPIGSSGGMTEIKSGVVDFGVSDAPLSPEQLSQDGLAQFPVVIGAIVPVVNLDGIAAGQLRLTGELLADIYLGKVKNWSDPVIAAMNPGTRLPDRAITVIHRSDGSGTTFNWVDYLSKVSGEWKTRVGASTTVAWPTGFGGNGNRGVADYVLRVKGAIGYVEFAYVLQRKMVYGLVQNRSGNFVQPNATSFQAATVDVDWAKTQDFYVLLTNAPGAGAYPIVATSFVLMDRKPKDAERSRDTLAFFRWALQSGQEMAGSLDYVPLPAPLVQKVETYWKAQIR